VGKTVGIESEKLVFDYLSRVGDLAHTTSMTASDRARLVSGLRTEIDKRRAAAGGAVTESAVKKILDKLGDPSFVVAEANGGVAPTLPPSAATPEPERSRVSLRKRAGVPKQAPEPDPLEGPAPTAAYGASSPHLADLDELGSGADAPDADWWRDASGGIGGQVPGFSGGIELAEVLRPPGPPAGAAPQVPAQATGEPVLPLVPAPGEEAPKPPPLWRQALARRAGAPGGEPGAAQVPRAGGLVEWAAVLLLVAGAAIGSLIPLALGWLAAWWSPRLRRTEGKWAAAGMPGLVAAGALLWLWGRTTGKWGDPLPAGGAGMQQLLSDSWPVLLRVAAMASALFLAWRARRPRHVQG
jgi:hypothetical protein